MTVNELTLYFSPSCPFCRKVFNFMQSRKINIPLKDVSLESSYRDELMNIGGKTQVPCLIINGEALYESDDIIQWLETNFRD